MAKMTKNGQKQPKNGPKWSEMFRQMVQTRPVRPTPNCLTENSEKLPKKNKNGRNYPKMAQNGLKWPKMA